MSKAVPSPRLNVCEIGGPSRPSPPGASLRGPRSHPGEVLVTLSIIVEAVAGVGPKTAAGSAPGRNLTAIADARLGANVPAVRPLAILPD